MGPVYQGFIGGNNFVVEDNFPFTIIIFKRAIKVFNLFTYYLLSLLLQRSSPHFINLFVIYYSVLHGATRQRQAGSPRHVRPDVRPPLPTELARLHRPLQRPSQLLQRSRP